MTSKDEAASTADRGSELNNQLDPLPPGREYIAGMNRHFAKVCGTVIAYSEDDLRAYGGACAAAEREAWSLLVSDLLSALEYHQEQTRPIHSTRVAIDAARAAIRSRSESHG